MREADVTILILGQVYGDQQGPERLSPTQQEYREARDRGDVLVFVQKDVTREPLQEAFVREVQNWSGGQYTAQFATADELHDAAIRALHELELSRKTGSIDESELLGRAKTLLVNEGSSSDSTLCVVVTGGPKQQVLRPAELESPALTDAIMQAALFGPDRVLDRSQGSSSGIRSHHLLIEQPHSSVLLTQLGDVRIVQPTQRETDRRSRSLPTLIEEEVLDGIARALRFAAWLLDHVDANRRLNSVAPLVSLVGGGYLGWLTKKEWEAHPNSVSMGMAGEKSIAVMLVPAVRPRPALAPQATAMAEDLTVLLRRGKKGR